MLNNAIFLCDLVVILLVCIENIVQLYKSYFATRIFVLLACSNTCGKYGVKIFDSASDYIQILNTYSQKYKVDGVTICQHRCGIQQVYNVYYTCVCCCTLLYKQNKDIPTYAYLVTKQTITIAFIRTYVRLLQTYTFVTIISGIFPRLKLDIFFSNFFIIIIQF